MSVPLERHVEREGCKIAFRLGWWECKIVSPARRGLPDRMYIRAGRVLFVEWKRPGEKASEQQLALHKEMRNAGAVVYVVDNLEDAKRIFE